jgi:DNA repair exonuclease SbcCD ATPase subunit
MKQNYSINPYTGKPNSSNTLEGYVISHTNSSSNKNNDSILKGYVDPNMLKHSSSSSYVNSHGSLFNHTAEHKSLNHTNVEYADTKVLSVGVPFVSNSVANIIDSGISSSDYISSIKHANSAQADKNYQEVANKAISILNEAKQVTDTILRADCHIPEIVSMGDSICKRLGQHFLHEAEYNDCAYPETRDEWKAKGERYLACNIYDIMKDNGILPSWGNQYLTPEENQEMIAQLRAQLEQLRLQMEQRDDIITARDDTIEQQANDLITKNNIIGERDTTIEQQANDLITKGNIITARDDTILELQTENHNLTTEKNDLTGRLTASEESNGILRGQVGNLTTEKNDLTDRLTISEENNGILQNRLDISEARVIPLQERVQELKDEKKNLETDKNELREDKKMLAEYNKGLQKEKELLLKEKDSFLIDKKDWQDLNFAKDKELTELKHAHFDIEHCTIVGHCNNPDHEVI